MNSLHHLKTASEEFKHLSISHELTQEQRKTRRKLIEKARKKKEDAAEDQFFRVVGTPDHPQILWVTKKKAEATSQQ